MADDLEEEYQEWKAEQEKLAKFLDRYTDEMLDDFDTEEISDENSQNPDSD